MEKYGRLTPIRRADGKGRDIWECRCDCGNTCYVRMSNLKSGHTRSCGCLRREMNKAKMQDLTGQRFGKLTVLGIENQKSGSHPLWKCQCDCGNIVEVSSKRLRNGINMSCGCYQKERQKYSMNKLHKKQFIENTNIDLIVKQDANKNSKSGVRGVHWCKSKKKWIATLKLQKVLLLNESFENKEDAIKARKEAEEKYFKPILEKYKNN